MERPTSITVCGVLNIVFGAIGLLCAPCMLVALLMPQGNFGGNPVMHAMQTNALYKGWVIGGSGIGFFAAIVLVVAGIGLLNLRNWARLLSIGYGIYAILMGITGTVIQALVLLPLVPQARGPEAAGLIGGVFGGLCGSVFGLAYPVVLIILMMRRVAIDACQP